MSRTFQKEAVTVVGVGALGALLLLSSLVFLASLKDPSPALMGVSWIPRAPSFLLVRMLGNPRWPGPRRIGTPRLPARTAQQQAIFEELLRRYEARQLNVAHRGVMARNQFERRQPFSVKTRARWPEGVPVRVTVSPQFAGLMPRVLRATPDYPGGSAVVAYDGGVELVRERVGGERVWKDRVAYEPGQQSIGTPPAGSREVVFRTTISEAGETIWQGPVVHTILVDGRIDEVLRPVDTPQVNALMASAIDGSLRLNADSSRVVLVPPYDPLLNDVTMGVLVDFVRGERVAATAVFRWRNLPVTPEGIDSHRRRLQYREQGWDFSLERWATLSGDLEALRAADSTDPEWRVRVRGDGATALEDYESKAYWSGTVTVPLARVRGGAPW